MTKAGARASFGGRFVSGLKDFVRAGRSKASAERTSGNAVTEVAYRAMGEPVAGALVGFVSRRS
jgi:hypothetical protein